VSKKEEWLGLRGQFRRSRCIAIPFLLLALTSSSCSQRTKGDPPQQTPLPQQAQAEPPRIGQAQEPAQLNFGIEQNDAEGYGGIAWGSEPDTSQPERWQYGGREVLDKVIGPPGEVNDIGADGQPELVFFSSRDTAPKMASYHPQDGGPYYGYYHGKLAWASTQVEGDLQQVQADIEHKYSTGLDVSATAWGDATNQQGVAVEYVYAGKLQKEQAYIGKLYKRGNTNTRIYLIQYLMHDQPMGKVYLLYIPNAYLTAIRDEWWATFRQAQQTARQQREDAAAKVRQSDQQKIQ
jgi:hypothetical protein